jgi:hypothetical protein
VAPRAHILLWDVYFQISGNAIYSYQVCPRRDSRAIFLRLSHARAKSEFLTLPNWDQPAKGDNTGRKHWSSRIAGG